MQKNTLKSRDRTKLKAGLVSTFATVFLSFIKFLGYLYTGSNALLADSLHSFTDSLSSVFVTVGIYLSTRKSKKFPYGLYKVENLVSLLVASFVIFAGIEITKSSIKGHNRIVNGKLGLYIELFSILISVLLGYYKIYVSFKTNSPSLKADGYHSISDALSSVVVFIGIALYPILPSAEKVSGIIVAFVLIYAGFEILKQSVLVLLDAQLKEEDIKKIINILESYRNIKIDFIRGRSSGSHYFLEIGISLYEHSLKKAHQITEDIERRIKEALPEVEDVVIHYEPLRKNRVVYAIPLLNHKPTIHIGRCEKFIIFEVYKNNKERCYTILNPGASLSSGRGAVAVKILLNEDVDVVLLPIEVREGMIEIMREFFKVEVDPEFIGEIIKKCKN